MSAQQQPSEPMPFDDLERVYAALATAIDRAGPARETVLLARLALLLGRDVGDGARVLARIEDALASLTHDPSPRPAADGGQTDHD